MRKKLLAAMAGLKERAKTLVELADGARFIVAERPLVLDDNAAGLLTAEARNLLGDLSADLKIVEPWSVETTEQAVRAFAERKGLKLGNVAQPLRAALTGRTTSPPIFDVLLVLVHQPFYLFLLPCGARGSPQSRIFPVSPKF